MNTADIIRALEANSDIILTETLVAMTKKRFDALIFVGVRAEKPGSFNTFYGAEGDEKWLNVAAYLIEPLVDGVIGAGLSDADNEGSS